jgi:hypothetical protein
MKRPQKDDKLKIKCESTSEVFEETCYESRPDKAHLPYGLVFDIATKRDYQKHVQYWLVGEDGEELGTTVVSISPRPSDWKRVVFSTIIPG